MSSRFRISALTEAQIGVIREGWRIGRPAIELVREIGCSDRTVRKYFGYFAQGWEYRQRRPRAIPKTPSEKKPIAEHRAPPTPRADRFYHSNFEPS